MSRTPETVSEATRSLPLNGRVALITGASRGIGAAVAAELRAAGAHIAANYRTAPAAAAELRKRDGPDAVSLWPADVADPASGEALVAGVLEARGRLDVLVLNAATWRGGRLEGLSDEDWRLVLGTSLDGSFAILRAAVPALRRSGAGRIVLMGSVVGLVGFPGDAAYATAKAGMLGLARSLAKELGRDGVTVNVVAPGLVETDMTAAVRDDVKARMVARTSLGRPATVGEVASAVRYLVCDGSYVTGHVLVVDGGFTL
ncbi:MAG TPA: SDR family oxidoreductase [Solirubrobacteraceae bacterium]|jgi:3-oxoacyl-[acyl-carrier protein] reductase